MKVKPLEEFHRSHGIGAELKPQPNGGPNAITTLGAPLPVDPRGLPAPAAEVNHA
jgi:hypothetical protein